ncbi:MAG: restriction endonuclease [Candidatus Omnitrophica bacterium]|nr:restriction endonuclease [Candidatus Omnitrophota bacterium]MDD5042320.1 restriction endonuclease [Candidatus Omnitrophota bacterium]MDD5500455.1 restriction endonuclease [Candidatus Omnitrophota bacterium]
MDIIFHYPPELFNLLIDTIPLLCKTKKEVILFFRGAGVDKSLIKDLENCVIRNPSEINKYEIVRSILTRLNEKGENALGERREILKRVTEFEDFSTCWATDQLKAKGLVSEIRRVVNVKDSFTRMNQEREEESRKRAVEHQKKIQDGQNLKIEIECIKKEFFSLFVEKDAHKRGKSLEGILNRFFRAYEILVRESFILRGSDGEGIIEQIDGVIEIEGELYLVEMKWWNVPLGVADVSQHLVRVFNRGHARGIYISASGYTEPAVALCKESLQRAVVVLCKLEEIVRLLEQGKDLRSFLKTKITASIIDKNPLNEFIV